MRFTKEFVLKIMENIPIGIVTIDGLGKITFANRAALEILGSPEEDQTKQLNVFTLKNIKDARAEQYFRDAIENRIPQFFEADYLSYRGKKCNLKCICMPVERATKYLSAILILEDITEMKKWERNLYQIKKMESIGILAGSLAHEFNNFLSIIFLNLDLLSEREEVQSSACKNIIESMRIAANEAGELVKKLLTFSRPKKTSIRYLKIEDLINNVLKMCHIPLSNKRIKIVRDLEKDVSFFYGDPLQIEQCLINLILNSKNAIEEEGTITIQTRLEEIGKGNPIQKAGIKSGRYLRLSVSDNGRGMSDETRQRIFEPFFTTGGNGEEGTGLGLTVVFSIVKEHGGFIEVESQKEVGTTFHLYFPLQSNRKNQPHD